MNLKDRWYESDRINGLRRFAVAITGLNILGHGFLGFEQSWAQPLVAVATAYSIEIGLESVTAWANRRPPRFLGGPATIVDFLLSAHITALAVTMLIYANDQMLPIALAVAIAIGSKAIFRVAIGSATRHIFNPSNFGISAVLLLFPWVGIAPPYHFSENLVGAGDWVLPGLIIASGTFLNFRFTKRLPLIGTWLGVFVLQALFRSVIFGTPMAAAWLPMTGLAFVLYTYYMVTDPATTPGSTRGQVIFGAAVGVTYGLLVMAHVVFGLFFALTIVCGVRGLGLYVRALSAQRAPVEAPPEVPAGATIDSPAVAAGSGES